MSASERIGAAIQAAVAKGRPALVGYLTAGFPSRRQFKDNLAAVAGGCDVVEIGVPFSDPMADGATVQRASFAALADGVTLPWILDELKSVEPRHTRTDSADELLESAAGIRNASSCRAPPREQASPASSCRICHSRKAAICTERSKPKDWRWCRW